VDERVKVSLDMEVDPSLRLQQAHEQSSQLEHDIQKEIPKVDEVDVHLEPLIKTVAPADAVPFAVSEAERKLAEIAHQVPGLIDSHLVEAHQVGKSVLVRIHCTVEPDLPVSLVHDITEDLGFRFRKAFPQILKVNIHAEPKART
jgi:divalent metal cation (Fe/Co/Zn/Cd) transporter